MMFWIAYFYSLLSDAWMKASRDVADVRRMRNWDDASNFDVRSVRQYKNRYCR